MAEARRAVPDLELGDRRRRATSATSRRWSRDLDAERWVTFAGRLSDDELVDLYRRAWVLAERRPLAEGWGMTITEAAACGTPAVVTDIPGHRDAVRRRRSGRARRPTMRDLARDISPTARRRGTRDRMPGRWPRSGAPSSRGKRPPPAPSPRWPAKRGGRPEARADGDRDRIETGADSPGVAAPLLRPRARSPTSRCCSPTGQVGADTKTYLYLDPGRLLARAPYLWDPDIGLGTVTHQNHRLPVADGAVVLADRAARCPGLGRPAPLARHDPVRRGRRRALPAADHGLARHGAPALAGMVVALRPTCSAPTCSTTPPASR